MAEIAGLVLGGIPIVIGVLEKYAEPFETYKNYRVVIETLRADLILQRRQLEATLSSVGLHDPSAVELRKCFETKFPGIHRELIIIIEQMDRNIAQLLKSLNVDINGKPQWTNDPPERAQWEWRRVKRSLASTKRKTLIDDLRKWNEDLKNCIERTQVVAEDETRQVQALIRKFNRKHCDLIRSCFRSFHRALEAALKCKCLSSHQATFDLDWNLSPSRTPWAFNAGLSYGKFDNSTALLQAWRKFRVIAGPDTVAKSQTTSSTSVSPTRAAPQSKADRSPLSRLADSFRRPHNGLSITPPLIQSIVPQAAVVESIENLCVEVRRRCTSWSISGCLQDPDVNNDGHFSHFSLEKTSEEFPYVINTISLRHLLAEQSQHPIRVHLALSAKQRYRIAASIAWSVLHLSDSPWIGEGWDQDEIKFFVGESRRGQELLSEHPCISYAFHEPMTMSQAQPTGRDFDHVNSKKTIFKLGLILIELSLKAPLEELRQRFKCRVGDPSSAAISDDYRTALNTLDYVYREAGDSYGNAVQRCIKLSFIGLEEFKRLDVDQFREQFYNTVVAPVQATYHMVPGSALMAG